MLLVVLRPRELSILVVSRYTDTDTDTAVF